MAERSETRDGGLRQFFLYLFVLGWLATIVTVALMMRAMVPAVDLQAELEALEAAETDEADPDEAPSALQDLSGPLPSFAVTGSSYVPLYASLYVGGQRSLKGLSATLSLRNRSADQALVITSVTYLDSAGATVAGLFQEPQVLAPMATAEFYIDQASHSGGPIAAAIVDWGAESAVTPPLVEAVIVGSYGTKSISFVSRGQDGS
jgi:hypothetical protein